MLDSLPELAAPLGAFAAADYLAEFSCYRHADRRFRFLRDEHLGPERYVEIMDELLSQRGVDRVAVGAGLWMDDACIVELRRAGHLVGLHSRTHPTRLARLSAAEQRREYQQNAEHLRGLLGEPIGSTSHPGNSYDERTRGILRDLGVRLGFRANMEPCSGALERPREDHARIFGQMMDRVA